MSQDTPIIIDETVIDEVYEAHRRRFRAQQQEAQHRKYHDPDRPAHEEPANCLFVWRDNAWQWVAFVVAKPTDTRMRKWRRRFGIRKAETLKVVDIFTASRGPIDNTPPSVRTPEAVSPLRTLQEALVVMPEPEPGRPFWGAVALGANSVVKLAGKGTSPLTNDRSEIRVQWADAVGRVSFGYLARTADKWLSPFVDRGVSSPRYVSASNQRISAYDRLRHTAGQSGGWRIRDWLITFSSPQRVPLFHAAIRELGGKVPATQDPQVAANTLRRLITTAAHTQHEGTTMSDATKTTKATKSTKSTKSTKAAKAPKAAAAAAAPAELAAEPVKPAKEAKVSKSTKTAKAPAKKTTKRTASAEPAAQPGRVSQYAGKVIVKLVDGNPRREGTHGFNSWSLLKKNMTYEQYIAAGGRRQDLAWDLMKGNCKLAKAAK